MTLRRKPRGEIRTGAFASRHDVEVESVIDSYMGRHGVAFGQWRGRAQITGACEMALGWLVPSEEITRILYGKEDAGEAEHRVVQIADEVFRHEWRIKR